MSEANISRLVQVQVGPCLATSSPYHPGAVEALHPLCSNFAVSIVTSASPSVVLQDVEALGFPVDRMIAIQCAEDTEHHKPDPLVFTPLKEKLAKRGIAPEQVMYIGDSASDYFAARDAGFAFTGFKRFNSRINPFGQFQVPIVSDLRQLAEFPHPSHL